MGWFRLFKPVWMAAKPILINRGTQWLRRKLRRKPKLSDDFEKPADDRMRLTGSVGLWGTGKTYDLTILTESRDDFGDRGDIEVQIGENDYVPISDSTFLDGPTPFQYTPQSPQIVLKVVPNHPGTIRIRIRIYGRGQSYYTNSFKKTIRRLGEGTVG
jgi:hypothetical protein